MAHLTTNLIVDSDFTGKAEISTSTWIHDFDGELKVVSVIGIRTGSCTTQNHLNTEETEALIANLQQHLHNIRTVELELIAQTQKEAA